MRQLTWIATLGMIFSLMASEARAISAEEIVQDLWSDVKQVWEAPDYDMYVPFYAWHNRLAYDDEHIHKYNEQALGFGLGKSYYDEEGNWHGLYAFGFKDSNSHFETVAGYAKMYNWKIGGNWYAGVGYTLGMTQRHEYSYIPVPMPLPIAEINYNRMMSLQAAYVPGLKNWGNVALLWVRAKLQ
ncbi:MAG: lipid IV(A) palmitoyltransferase PagP [Alphaproteobacteria bacterium]|nr:lipid IV(A) palmitoyltransferase PagP [Alphaproteobacteria bacterium]